MAIKKPVGKAKPVKKQPKKTISVKKKAVHAAIHRKQRQSKTKLFGLAPRVAGLIVVVIIVLAVFASYSLRTAPAKATMELQLSSTRVAVGERFKVAVYTNSSDTNVNAVQATVSYPTDLLEFADVNNESSGYPIKANQVTQAGSIEITKGVIGGVTGRTLVSEIEFVARKSGKIKIGYDREGTVLLASANSSNILKSNSFKQVTVEVENAK